MTKSVLFGSGFEKIDMRRFFFLPKYAHYLATGLARAFLPLLTLVEIGFPSKDREQAYQSSLYRQASFFFHPLQYQTCVYAR